MDRTTPINLDDDLSKRFRSFHLTEEEQSEVKLLDDDVTASEAECRTSLFGKIISQKPVNFGGLKTTMGLIWGNPKDFRVLEIGKGIYQFILPSETDAIRILNGKPWFFNNHFLILEKWNPKLQPSQYSFKHTPIWVQIWGLPIQFISAEVGQKIGAKIGFVDDVSIPVTGSKEGRFARVRTHMDVSEPLKRGCMVKLGSNPPFWVEFRYERLPMFCRYCGLVGHDLHSCTTRFLDIEEDTLRDAQYGAWIRASPATQSGRRGASSPSTEQNYPADLDKVGCEIPAADKGNTLIPPLSNPTTKPGEAGGSKSKVDDFAHAELVAESRIPMVYPTFIPITQVPEKGSRGKKAVAYGRRKVGEPPISKEGVVLIQSSSEPSPPMLGKRKTTVSVVDEGGVTSDDGDLVAEPTKRSKRSTGVGRPLTFHQLKEFSRLHSPSLFFLSETKNEVTRMQVVKRALGMDGSLWVDPTGLAGGLAVFWKGTNTVEVMRVCSWFIDVKVNAQSDANSWRLVNVYFSSRPEVRKDQWEAFQQYKQCLGEDWVLWGDMNCIISSDEKRGGLAPLYSTVRGFKDFIDQCHLLDLGFTGYPFTWRNNRDGEGQIQERLDRALASPSWRTRFSQATIEHVNAVGSDHSALILHLNPSEIHRWAPFRFDARWVQDEEVDSIVKTVWAKSVPGSRLFKVHHRIKECRCSLINWKK
ncbi:hypothetical protein Vadar_022585 [Vaccinium darrowii]|uniref:Uncharacterized protein n=1 Tax=Vaccinium darrowii TaxID=229202 RepID=A0ACB7Y297_9ERIC|nr:hypothetical protein Vadar_022585 [Vaccinium darrowii]